MHPCVGPTTLRLYQRYQPPPPRDGLTHPGRSTHSWGTDSRKDGWKGGGTGDLTLKFEKNGTPWVGVWVGIDPKNRSVNTSPHLTDVVW